jgi:hypothetical protein
MEETGRDLNKPGPPLNFDVQFRSLEPSFSSPNLQTTKTAKTHAETAQKAVLAAF